MCTLSGESKRTVSLRPFSSSVVLGLSRELSHSQKIPPHPLGLLFERLRQKTEPIWPCVLSASQTMGTFSTFMTSVDYTLMMTSR
jgi:hypothetical protein